jgi:hypothetical protein
MYVYRNDDPARIEKLTPRFVHETILEININ